MSHSTPRTFSSTCHALSAESEREYKMKGILSIQLSILEPCKHSIERKKKISDKQNHIKHLMQQTLRT